MIKRFLTNSNFPFWLFTISILILLTVPKLIQDGMFLDGMLYTCVSHNLSNGIGSFWSPEFSPSYINAGSVFFHEQPPLVFGIQSLFFRLLGDSMYVERFYTFLTMCITAYLIKVLWDSTFRNEERIKTISWLPLILWITIPTCFWSYSNNMMENSMGIFTLGSVVLIYKFIRYYNISLYINEQQDYLMVKKTSDSALSGDFEKLNIDTRIYDLYLKKKAINP